MLACTFKFDYFDLIFGVYGTDDMTHDLTSGLASQPASMYSMMTDGAKHSLFTCAVEGKVYHDTRQEKSSMLNLHHSTTCSSKICPVLALMLATVVLP